MACTGGVKGLVLSPIRFGSTISCIIVVIIVKVLADKIIKD